MATKQQERDALNKIKSIVESLGENSYIGAAFDGCFEIAAENIESDFLCSMKQRKEIAEEKAQEHSKLVSELTEKVEANKKVIDELRCMAISIEDLGTIRSIIYGVTRQLGQDVKDAAEQIVTYADDPRSSDFKGAVIKHRTSKDLIDRYKELIHKINGVIESFVRLRPYMDGGEEND